jgi:hypothetical protein
VGVGLVAESVWVWYRTDIRNNRTRLARRADAVNNRTSRLKIEVSPLS